MQNGGIETRLPPVKDEKRKKELVARILIPEDVIF